MKQIKGQIKYLNKTVLSYTHTQLTVQYVCSTSYCTISCDMFDVIEKNAIVTGSARGLGKAMVKRLLESGANVCISDVDLKAGEETLKEFQEQFGQKRVVFVK
jgi:3-oxoacyl-ACP reductase-like protein